MAGIARAIMIGTTAASLAAIITVLFLWIGPGVDAFQTRPAPALFDGEQIEELYKQASPAVVAVMTSGPNPDSPFNEGAGSGFLVDPEGLIVTNYHVVKDATNIRVKLSDGSIADASIRGSAPAYDLALLEVDPSELEDVIPLPLGAGSLVRPGQLAIAIGNPLGLEGSVTAGIISGINRQLPSQINRTMTDIIQTDAALFPGSSGGPLLNERGAVVGINTAIRVSPSGSNTTPIGFSVSVDTLKTVLPQLKEGGTLQPPWLGVAVDTVDDDLAKRLDLPVMRGVYVIRVEPGSPSDNAGLIEAGTGSDGRAGGGGDIITHVNDVPVTSVADLVSQLNRYVPGDVVTLTLRRGDDTEEVDVALGQWPESLGSRNQVIPEVPFDPFHPFFPFNPDGD